MIFHKFWYGPVGVRFQDMNIYTFWIDLDTLNPDLEESSVVWDSGGRLSQKLKNSGRGSGACAAWGPLGTLVCLEIGRGGAQAESPVQSNARSLRIREKLIIFGASNGLRNHDGTDVKIMMKSEKLNL